MQALRDLMGQLLSESDTQLQQWKSQILDAVGATGQVIIDVIPELERIIGQQPPPPVPELSGSAAQNRFNLLFGKFIQVFTTKEHPLVMFLDDLQWADSASLNLMKLLKQKLSSLSSATLTSLTQRTMSQTKTGMEEILDLATLMKASRTLSEDISLDGAIANLMQVVRENAGAETVALMLFTEQELMLTAVATGQEFTTIDPIPVVGTQAVPLSIVNQVKRSQKPLVLDNVSNNNAYASDAYIQKYQPQSILCLPLVDRGHPIGILYLENNQITGAFTTERVEVLNLLCSQAAISLENALLYQESQNYAQTLEQTQLQLVQSEKMASIGQLVSGVAHEINNPVGFISGNLDYATEYIQDLMDLLQLYQQ